MGETPNCSSHLSWGSLGWQGMYLVVVFAAVAFVIVVVVVAIAKARVATYPKG